MGAVKTFIKYPGGKSRLLIPIMEKLPRAERFTDVFCGGGSVSLAYAQKYPGATIHMNDYDKFTYAIWNIIVNGTDEDIARLSTYISQTPTIALFNHNRERMITEDMVERAYLGIFFHKCTFSGMFNANPIGGVDQKSQWKIGCHYTVRNLLAKIGSIRRLLRGRTIVTNLDFRDMNIDSGVVYFDPPYVSVGDKLYAVSFTDKDHRDLSEYIKNTKLPWLLSYNEDPLVRELYKECNILSINHTMTMSSFCEDKKCKVKPELLITQK